MVFVAFNGGVATTLQKINSNQKNLNDVFMLFLPLEIGNIKTPENSKTNEILYDVVAGKGAYSKFKSMSKINCQEISTLNKSEKVYFWIDFNDVKQVLNFAYYIDQFADFKDKFLVQYDFNDYCENPNNINFYFVKNKILTDELINEFKSQLKIVQKQDNMIFRAIVDGFLTSVKDDYFDKFIMEFLSEKPKQFMQIIAEINAKYGRLAVSFDQVVIRLWMLMREGVVERVGHGSEFGLFFEYKYKLSDHIDMQRD